MSSCWAEGDKYQERQYTIHLILYKLGFSSQPVFGRHAHGARNPRKLAKLPRLYGMIKNELDYWTLGLWTYGGPLFS